MDNKNKDNQDQAFENMLKIAYGIHNEARSIRLKDRLPRWVKMSLLDIGKEMYGTIHTPDQRAVRDAYIKGLSHGMTLKAFQINEENK